MHLHLHLRRRDTLIADIEGSDFKSVEEARDEAILTAREIMADRLRSGLYPFGATFHIAKSDGATVALLPFRAAVPVDD